MSVKDKVKNEEDNVQREEQKIRRENILRSIDIVCLVWEQAAMLVV